MTSLSCRLDHIAVIAPSLDAGITWVEACLGVSPRPGGEHPQMGTHNHLLKLGDDFFLEVIAADPAQASPQQARWFGLDDVADLNMHWAEGRRLRGMVARSATLEACLASEPQELGQAMRLTRGTREWRFGVRFDGRLPLDGAGPHIMDWGAQGPAAPQMNSQGCRLLALILETPQCESVQAFYNRIGLVDAPQVRTGLRTRLIAAIETPSGVRLLT